MKRLIYITHSPLPSQSANGAHVMKMCEAFAADGASEVALIATRGSAAATTQRLLDAYGIANAFKIDLAPNVDFPYLGEWLRVRAVSASVKRHGPTDVYYGQDISMLARLAQESKPVAIELGRMPRPGRLLHLRQLIIATGFLGLVVTDGALGRELRGALPSLKDGDLLVAPAGIDPPAGSVMPRTGLPSWPGRAGHLQAGYIGSLYPGRGIELVEELARRAPDIDFHIVGTAPDDIKRWQRKGEGNLKFFGFVPASELRHFLASFDVLLAPYKDARGQRADAPLSSRLFELMAAGKPIIAADLPAVLEFIAGGGEALVASAGDPAAWIEHLRRLETDPTLAHALGAAAREKLVARYTWAGRARVILSWLEARLALKRTLIV